MTMKVTKNIPSPIQTAEAAKTSRADALIGSKRSKGTAGAPDAGLGSARVDLSSRAQDMARAKELATPSDSIDEAKVARLQRMIDEGKYRVDSGAVADRLLDEHLKMDS
jgi:flagellar biosynthesis anti-sigma factor FlgM